MRRPALQDKSGSIKLPIAGGSTRRTDHLGSFLLRHLCLEIGRRGGARGTVMLTFVSRVHNSKIMLGMLIKVLCGHAIATRRRLSREGSVTFEDLMRGASDLDVRSGTIETVTSLRDLWPITVRIVTVITTMRSAVLSCSHETFCVDGKLDRFPNRACGTPSQSGGVGPLFCGALAPSRRYVRWGRPYFQQFFGTMPRRIRPHCRRFPV